MTQNLPYGFEISEEYATPDAVYYLSYRGEGVGVYYTLKAAEAAARVERISFHTVAQLIAALEKLAMAADAYAPGIASLDQMYVQDAGGVNLDTLEAIPETLSDNSVVFNVVLFTGRTR